MRSIRRSTGKQIAILLSSALWVLGVVPVPAQEPIGWAAIESGGGSSPGHVDLQVGRAALFEGDSFLVSAHRAWGPSGGRPLTFRFIPEPGFDRTDRFAPDAFEVSLLDASGNSLVPVWKRGATSFFNLQEDGTAHRAQGVTFDGDRVTVDVSAVPSTAQGTLYFDLIGGDHDTGSGITILLNQPPVCDAGASYSAECAGASSSVQLDGSRSSDPDGESLTYHWTTDCPSGAFDDPTLARPMLSLNAAGQCALACTVRLEVSDGVETSTCEAQVTIADNTPPTLQCPADKTVECDGHGNTAEFNAWLASASATDACNTVSISNNFGGGFPDAATHRGALNTTWTARDACNLATTCSAKFTIADSTAPTIRVLETVLLWPANHEYRSLRLSDCKTITTDKCAGALNVNRAGRILSIYSDEPEDAKGAGDGATQKDIVITGPSSFQLRAERDGGTGGRTPKGGNGRVYGVEFELKDPAGNVTQAICRFGVAHDQSGPMPVDDGPAAGYIVRP